MAYKTVKFGTVLNQVRRALGYDPDNMTPTPAERIRDGELAWTARHDPYPTEPSGETLAVSRRLLGKYSADASAPVSGANLPPH